MGYTQQNNSTEETVGGSIHINLSILLKDLLRNLVTVILIALIVSGIVYTVKENTAKPKYQSSATLLLSTADGSTSLSGNSSMTTLVQEIMGSSLLKKIVAADLGLDSATVPATITTIVQDTVNVVTVTVTADTPRMSFEVLDSILKNYSQVSDYLMDGLVLEVLEPAAIPYRAIAQTGARALFKTVFSYTFVILMVGVMVLSLMRDTVKSRYDMEEKVDAPLFATIYRETGGTWKKNLKAIWNEVKRRIPFLGEVKKQSILINDVNTSFSFVESFKKIRTKLEHEARKNDCKMVMITSVTENEGKSTVAANIALSLAQKSDKVLLLDADFRKPAQYKVLEAEKKEQGFGDVLQGKCQLEDVMCRYEKGNIKLNCLYNYRTYQNSAELLMSGEFEKTLNQLREDMDYIIVDTSPTAMVADAEIVSGYTDGFLVVVREDCSGVGEINDTIDMLSRYRSHLLGCIYNFAGRGLGRAIQNSDAYGSYGKYGKYGSYGRYGYGYGYGNQTKTQESNANKTEVSQKSERDLTKQNSGKED